MKRILTCIAIILTAQLAIAQKSFKLKLNLEKDKVYYSESAMQQEIQMQQPNGPLSMKQAFTFGYDMKVNSITDSGTLIETTYRKFKVSMMNMEFNSDTPATGNAMFQKIFGSMIGKSFYMVVDKSGAITSVKGMHALVTSMIKDLPANPQMEAGLRNEYNDARMLQNFNQSFNIFSTAPVKVGSTWTKQQNVNLLGNGVSNTVYTVTAITKALASLQAKSTHEFDMNIGAGGKLSGTSVSAIDVDVKSGFPLKGKMDMTLSGNMKNGEGETPAKIISSINITGYIK